MEELWQERLVKLKGKIMQTITRYKNVRISTRKVRYVADSISGLSIDEALDALSVIPNRGSRTIEKALNSAVANAVNNSRLDKNKLVIKHILVNEGKFLKRFRPSTRGRIHPYKLRATNLRIVLEEEQKKIATNVKKDAKPVKVEKTEVKEEKKEGDK